VVFAGAKRLLTDLCAGPIGLALGVIAIELLLEAHGCPNTPAP
jgi:hypothetical protein